MEDALNKKRFLWGLLLAWVPWVPTLIGVGYLLNNSKATGLAALVGSFAQLLLWWGIAAIVISQIAATIWLVRSFARNGILDSLMAAVSIIASGATLALVCAFLLWGLPLLRGSTR